MGSPARGLLDTSVFIAAESARPLDVTGLPDQGVVCPITIAELHAGVLAADDIDVRARRLATLESIADVEVLPIDADVAAEWARAVYRSVRGPISSAWRRDGDTLELEVEIPANVTATVIVPGGEPVEVGAGLHRFSGALAPV